MLYGQDRTLVGIRAEWNQKMKVEGRSGWRNTKKPKKLENVYLV
jgi:hypothetical protein